MSNPNNETVVFYNPPLTPAGDRDWRKEVRGWMSLRNTGNAPLDLNTIVVIDNLLDALDAARKERDDARASVRFMEKMADILNDEANAEIEQLRKENA